MNTIKVHCLMADMAVHAFNPSTLEAGLGR